MERGTKDGGKEKKGKERRKRDRKVSCRQHPNIAFRKGKGNKTWQEEEGEILGKEDEKS